MRSSACFAAVAGVLLLGFTGSAYGDVGQPYLFQTIAAVVIGGAALVGGRGCYLGTIAGALVLTEINTLLIGLGFQPPVVQAALGLDHRRCWSRSTAASGTSRRRSDRPAHVRCRQQLAAHCRTTAWSRSSALQPASSAWVAATQVDRPPPSVQTGQSLPQTTRSQPKHADGVLDIGPQRLDRPGPGSA